jgi:hypothetical protein
MATTFRQSFRSALPVSPNGTGQRPKRTPILVVAGRLAGRLAGRTLPRVRAVRSAAMQCTAGGLATWAGWQTDPRLGAAVGAVSLLVLEALSGSDGP